MEVVAPDSTQFPEWRLAKSNAAELALGAPRAIEQQLVLGDVVDPVGQPTLVRV
jgi:hypothetical protein